MGGSPLGLGLNSTMCYYFTIWTIHYTKVYFLPSGTPTAQDCARVLHHTVVLLVFQPRVSFIRFSLSLSPLSPLMQTFLLLLLISLCICSSVICHCLLHSVAQTNIFEISFPLIICCTSYHLFDAFAPQNDVTCFSCSSFPFFSLLLLRILGFYLIKF